MSPTAAYGFAGATLLAWLLVPIVARFVRKIGAVVLPGGRATHTRRTPLLGGVAVFVPFFVATITLGILGDVKAIGIAAGATVMLICGIFDDLKHVRPRTKILASLLAGGCLVATGFRIPVVSAPGIASFPLGSLETPLLLVWVVLATNAFNLTDGMDGLAASLAIVGCAGSALVGSNVLPAVVLAGAALGFLRHNLPRASIFLGDAGSLLIGFALAAFALDVPVAVNIPVAYALLAYSLGDVAMAVTRRYMRAKPLFVGDKSHIHHKLREHLRSPYGALAAVLVFATAHLTLALAVPGIVSLSISLLLWIVLAVGLMIVGRVHVHHLLDARISFQRIHLVRQYVTGRLRLAEHASDIESGLHHLVKDLNLSSLAIGDLRIDNPAANDGQRVEVSVPLKERDARWSYVPTTEQRAVDDERRSVVCEAIRTAVDRSVALARRKPGAPPRHNGVPPPINGTSAVRKSAVPKQLGSIPA